MERRLLIVIIIIAVIIAIMLGAYLILGGSNSSNINQAGQGGIGLLGPNSFEVNGLKVEILKEGTGVEAKVGDTVTVNYVGYLENGTKFDSSIDRNAPFTFPIGQERVIKGFDSGVVGMKFGEKRKLVIPPALGYGSTALTLIPANSTLVYDIEMLKITK